MAIKNKEGKSLSKREQAKKVREWTGWSREQYNKEYDKLRNRVRAYERATGARKGSINVADLLARNARGEYFKRTYGSGYKPSELYQAVLSAPSVSSGKTVSGRATQRIQAQAVAAVDKQFFGVINNSKYSQDIAADVAELRKSGNYTPEAYRDLVEGYARRLGREREEIARINSAIQDPFKKMFFNS